MSAGPILLLTVLFTGYIYFSLAQPNNVLELRCKMHPAVKDTNVCPHGAAENPCGKLACLKGRGESCGQLSAAVIMYGRCATGLMCCGGLCVGCRNGLCDQRMCPPRNKIMVAGGGGQDVPYSFGDANNNGNQIVLPLTNYQSRYNRYDYYSSESD